MRESHNMLATYISCLTFMPPRPCSSFMYTELPTVLGEVWKFSAKFLLLAKLANVSIIYIIVQYMLHSLLVCTEVDKAYF